MEETQNNGTGHLIEATGAAPMMAALWTLVCVAVMAWLGRVGFSLCALLSGEFLLLTFPSALALAARPSLGTEHVVCAEALIAFSALRTPFAFSHLTRLMQVRKGGNVVLVGLPKQPVVIENPLPNLLFRSITLRTVCVCACIPLRTVCVCVCVCASA